MKTKYSTLLSKTTLALCGLMMTAPYAGANEESSLNRADEKFITNAASHDMEEVKLAELAVRKAVNPEVKAYAESIVADHNEFDKNLVNLAGSKSVDLSAEIKTYPSRTYRNLEKTDRKNFDKKFLDQMIDAQEKNVNYYVAASEDSEDAEVKAFAIARLPMLRTRHEKIIELRTRENERTADPDTTKRNNNRNVRDRDDNEVTSFDQDSSQRDIEIFIKNAASHDMEEVKLAELGVRKAVNPEVKVYAVSIVADHKASAKNLVNLAAAKRVDLSSEIKTDSSRTYKDLEKTDRENFDKKFLDQMIDAQENNVSFYEDASENTEDAEVKAFAMKQLPILRTRHEKIIELRNREIERTTDPDNTKRNVRDRDDNELTPFDQGSSKRDTEITANIRKAILDVDDMSTNGKNVKIITKDGMVTLRGPVNSAAEKNSIDEIAHRIVNVGRVDSQLEVKVNIN